MPVLGSFHIELCSTGTVFLSGWWRRRLCLSSRKGWQIHLATDCMNIWSNSTSLLTSPILGVDDGQGSYCTPPLQESHPVFPLVCAAPFSSWGVVRSARGTYPNLSILSCFLACSCCLSSITHSTFHCHLKKRLLHQLCIHRYIALVCTFGIQQYIRYIPCRRTIPIPNPMPKYWSFLAISSYQKELARLCTTKVSLPSFSST